MRRVKKHTTLPNAPLAEVVFELRWALHNQSKSNQMLMQSDPGFIPALDTFSRKIVRAGFGVIKDIADEPNKFVLPYSVSRRFYAKQDFGFPLLQLGPGIFASNQTAEYEWKSFKKQSTLGTKYIVSSYPKLRSFPERAR
jgi:uncharacterized protein (TIGR04255 family)